MIPLPIAVLYFASKILPGDFLIDWASIDAYGPPCPWHYQVIFVFIHYKQIKYKAYIFLTYNCSVQRMISWRRHLMCFGLLFSLHWADEGHVCSVWVSLSNLVSKVPGSCLHTSVSRLWLENKVLASQESMWVMLLRVLILIVLMKIKLRSVIF